MSEEFIDLRKVREIVNEYIRVTVGEVEEEVCRITFAVRDTFFPYGREVWRINVEYTPKPKKKEEFSFTRSSLFTIDAKTAKVIEFKEGYTWSF